MPSQTKDNGRTIAERVVQIGRIVHGDGFVEGLTPAQWTALRYFSRANRFSRTVSAFAEFHATTRGTASQTVKSLVNNGYLTRKRSEQDRRSVCFDITEASLALLARDPFQNLIAATSELSHTSREVIGRGLDQILLALTEQDGKQPFGVCLNCTYLRAGACCANDAPDYHCELLGETLAEPELGRLCINFSPAQ